MTGLERITLNTPRPVGDRGAAQRRRILRHAPSSVWQSGMTTVAQADHEHPQYVTHAALEALEGRLINRMAELELRVTRDLNTAFWAWSAHLAYLRASRRCHRGRGYLGHQHSQPLAAPPELELVVSACRDLCDQQIPPMPATKDLQCTAHRITSMVPAAPGASVLTWDAAEAGREAELKSVTLWLAVEHLVERDGEEWSEYTVEAWASERGYFPEWGDSLSCMNWRDGPTQMAFGSTSEMEAKYQELVGPHP